MRAPHWCWGPSDINWTLSAMLGATVYEKSADAVITRSLELMRNPVWFASTAYPRALYEEVEGYRGQGLINPDKEFHWRVISAADSVVFLDIPLFSYRVHPSNQDSQQAKSGALKRLVDQYVLSFNADPAVRERGGATNDDLARNFVREDIAKRAILSLIERNPTGRPPHGLLRPGRLSGADAHRSTGAARPRPRARPPGDKSIAGQGRSSDPAATARPEDRDPQSAHRHLGEHRSGVTTSSEPRLRVLFCIPELDRGGPDSVYFNLLRTLDVERFEPFLAVTNTTGAYLAELPDHIPVLAAGHGRYPVRSVIHHVRAVRPDVVLATLRMSFTCGAARPFFPRGTRLIYRVANNVSGEIEEMARRSPTVKAKVISASYRVMVEIADTVIAQSHAMRDDIGRQFGERAARKTVVLPEPRGRRSAVAVER